MAARKTYLVDTENVGTVWKKILPELKKNDSLILFYTQNSPGVSYPDLNEILSYGATFEMIEGYTGRNALDFQIVTYLGYLLKSASKTEYTIVSNDAGYDAVTKFWSERDYQVNRLTTEKILNLSKKETLPEEESQSAREMISKIIGRKDENEITDLYDLILPLSPKDKQGLHVALTKKYGQNGTILYRQLKPNLVEIKKQMENE